MPVLLAAERWRDRPLLVLGGGKQGSFRVGDPKGAAERGGWREGRGGDGRNDEADLDLSVGLDSMDEGARG